MNCMRIRGIRAFTKHSLLCWPRPHHPIAQFQCYVRPEINAMFGLNFLCRYLFESKAAGRLAGMDRNRVLIQPTDLGHKKLEAGPSNLVG